MTLMAAAQVHAADCGNVSPTLKSVCTRVQAYRKSCPLTKDSPPIVAVSDFAKTDSTVPYQYIFDENGSCLARFPAAYGKGQKVDRPTNRVQVPQSMATDSYATPQGYHILRPIKAGSKFHTPGNKALLMEGLEGQDSAGRDIYLHATERPGEPATLGCTGLSREDLAEARKYLDVNSLVYNYFGSRNWPSENGENCTTSPLSQEQRRHADQLIKGMQDINSAK